MDGLSGHRAYSGIGDCITKTYHNEGVKGFFRGMPTTLIRSFPVNAVTFTVVNWCMRTLAPSSQNKSSVTYQDASSYQMQESLAKTVSFAQDHQVFGRPHQNEWLAEWKSLAPTLVIGGINSAGSIPIRNYTVHCSCSDWFSGALDSLAHQVHNISNSGRTIALIDSTGSTAGLLYNCHCQEAGQDGALLPVQVSPGDSDDTNTTPVDCLPSETDSFSPQPTDEAVRSAANQAADLNANL